MDFALNDTQNELRELTARIAGDACTLEHLRLIADSDSGTDLDLWRTLAEAGLVGIGMSEANGGGGLGWLETCVVISELARVSAPVPSLAVMAMTGPALDEQPDLADGIATGDRIVAAAVHEPTGDVMASRAQVENGRLSGIKTCVLHGHLADGFVVTASDGLYYVDAADEGVTVEAQVTATDTPDAHVVFVDAIAQRVGDVEASQAMIWRGMSAASIMTAAACEEAVKLLSEYAVERKQFDKPIAAFQAVSQRAGDAYIDTEAVRLTGWQAAWRMHEGLSFEKELLTAKFWAAEGGWRALHGAMHLHGGVSVDRDYPLHRHFLMQKQCELQLGSATPTLLALGKRL